MSISETTFKNTQGKVVDPVCGMSVNPDSTELFSVYKGCRYYFCTGECLKSFEANPERDLKPKPVKKKGWFGRYLERMAKINEKEFGRTGPRCCR